MWGYQMNDNGTLTTHGSFEVEDPATYQTDVLARKAVEQIDAAASGTEPFFMTLWFLAPHRELASLSNQLAPRPAPRHASAFATEPLPKPPSFNEKDMSDKPLFMRVKPRLNTSEIATITNQYRAELETLLSVDEAVASVVGALEANGVLGNTYVIFTSDNGYFHGEHRTPDEKILGYENSARVPLVIRGPGIAAGTHVRELVANVDLAPTIAAWAGATPGLQTDGRSLMPFMLDPAKRTRRPVLLEAFWPFGSTLGFFTEQLPASGVVVRPEGVAPVALPGPLSALPLGKTIMPYEAVRADRYVYFEYATGEHELYDLAVDPWQLSSRHLDPAYLQTQVALALALTKLRLCGGAACRAQTPVIPDPA